MRKNTKKIDAIILLVLVLLFGLIVWAVVQSAKPQADSGTGLDHPAAAEDYNGRKIGILTGTNMEQESFDHFPDSEYFYYDGYPNLNTALLNGTIDAYLGDEPALKSIHAEQPGVDYIKQRLTNNRYSFAFRKNDPEEAELLRQFNAFLAEANADGTIAEIDAIWFGTDESKKVVDMSDLTGENGTIHVVTTTTDEPFSYIKDNQNVGYDIDVVVRFCRANGYALELGDVDFQARIPALESGKFEFTTSMNVTPEREEEVMFSDPVSEGGIVVAVRAEDLGADTDGIHISDFNDAKYTIGAATGASGMLMAEQYLPNAKLILYDDIMPAVESVRLGKIDGFIYERNQLEIVLQNDVTGVRILDEDVGDTIEVAVGISRAASDPELKKKLNAFLAEKKADGTIDELYDRWMHQRDYTMPDIPAPEHPEGKLLIGTTGIVEPYSFYQDNELTGCDIELARRFAQWANVEIEFQMYDYASIVAAAESGTVDCIFANLNVTTERQEVIDFSDTIYSVDNAMLVAEDIELGQETFLERLQRSFEKNFIREDRYKLILEGIGTTCLLTVLSVLFGTVLAFLICLFRRTGSRLANRIANIYVKLLQGTPMVVLLMILYYIIFGRSSIAAVWVAVIGFTLNFGAYTSEIMRSGIESVDSGQREAALALGYNENQTFFRFIFPQAAVRFLPVYNGEVVSLLKSTSIVGYIAIQDLTKMSDIIRSRTYEAFFPLIATAIIYFILAWLLSLLLKLVLRQIDPRSRQKRAKEAS